MTYTAELKQIVTLRDYRLFELRQNGFIADITRIEWVLSEPHVTVYGYGQQVGSSYKDRPWQSIVQLEELPDDIRKALKAVI